MVMAPMPGLGPEDIVVRIDGRHVVIHGDARGPHQDDVNLSIAEWAVGPYHRELDLPEGVDGVVTNATYGNGVLVLSMPKLRAGHAGTAAEFRLVTVANAHEPSATSVALRFRTPPSSIGRRSIKGGRRGHEHAVDQSGDRQAARDVRGDDVPGA
jgi:hypothetical protein